MGLYSHKNRCKMSVESRNYIYIYVCVCVCVLVDLFCKFQPSILIVIGSGSLQFKWKRCRWILSEMRHYQLAIGSIVIQFQPIMTCLCLSSGSLWHVYDRGSGRVWPTGPTHAKLVFLTSPCCSGWPAPMNTLKANNGPLGSVGCAGFNARLKSDLVLIFYFNSTNE